MKMFEMSFLGESPADPAAWGQYVAGLRDAVATAKSSAVAAYNTLKQVRTNLGLPFYATVSGEKIEEGGWSEDLDQQAVDATAMANLLTAAADDVLAGKRKLLWDDKVQDFAIEGFPSDTLRLQKNASGDPILVDASGNTQHVKGQVGIAPVILFGAVVVLALVQALVIYLVVKKALETLQIIAEQKTQRTLAEAAKKHADLVASGKATPDEAANLNKSIYSGATELQKAQTQSKAPQDDQFQQTVRTLGYIALGLGVLYVIVRLVPTPAGRGAMALNPRREPPDETAVDELEIYIDNDARFAMQAEGSQGAQIASNLWKKWEKGTYDSSKAPKAWSYMVENAAKAYSKEFSNPGDEKYIFNPATRDEVARHLTEQFEMFARDGTFEKYPPKPFTRQVFGRLPPAA